MGAYIQDATLGACHCRFMTARGPLEQRGHVRKLGHGLPRNLGRVVPASEADRVTREAPAEKDACRACAERSALQADEARALDYEVADVVEEGRRDQLHTGTVRAGELRALQRVLRQFSDIAKRLAGRASR